jgi:hypothetical protein
MKTGILLIPGFILFASGDSIPSMAQRPAPLVSAPLSSQSGQASPANTTYYVSANGDDRTGTPSNPAAPYRSPHGAYSAIPADITSAAGDHVIELTDSTVYGQLGMTPKITDATHRIILRAASGMTPIMDAYSVADGSPGRGDSNPPLRVQTSHVVIRGLRFHNTSLDPTIANHQVMVRVDGSNVVIEDNYFDGNGRSPTPFDMFLLVCNGASDNVISGNRFDYSGGKGLIYVGPGCGGGSPGRQIIRNNVLSRFGNNPQAICAAINFGGATAGNLAGNNSIVENNTIYDNGGGCYGLLNTNGSALTVRNNIFSKITGRRFAIGCSGVNGSSSGIAYNSVMHGNTNNVEAACAGGGGWTLSTVYSEDPYFVEPTASPPDLHVESTAGSRRNGTSDWIIDKRCSVAIDQAAPADAFEFEPSPNGARRNLGAYGNTLQASKSCSR